MRSVKLRLSGWNVYVARFFTVTPEVVECGTRDTMRSSVPKVEFHPAQNKRNKCITARNTSASTISTHHYGVTLCIAGRAPARST